MSYLFLKVYKEDFLCGLECWSESVRLSHTLDSKEFNSDWITKHNSTEKIKMIPSFFSYAEHPLFMNSIITRLVDRKRIQKIEVFFSFHLVYYMEIPSLGYKFKLFDYIEVKILDWIDNLWSTQWGELFLSNWPTLKNFVKIMSHKCMYWTSNKVIKSNIIPQRALTRMLPIIMINLIKFTRVKIIQLI